MNVPALFITLALLAFTVPTCVTLGVEPLFSETFDAEVEELGRSAQFGTRLHLKFAHQYPGWVKEGDAPVHFALQAKGDWSLMIFADSPGDNVLTLKEAFDANEEGKEYVICVDVGPGTYADFSQATIAGDEVLLELLRKDDSVLASFTVSPRPWDTNVAYEPTQFEYRGDGKGPLRFRLTPQGHDVRFYGAIDNLQVFASAADAKEAIAKRMEAEQHREVPRAPIPFLSPTPRQVFSTDPVIQEQELQQNELMKRFAKARLDQAGDRYRPAYHFVSPESMLNDPNGLCFWNGRWHLFYQAYPPDEFPRPNLEDIMQRRQHWGHAVSDDLVHWRDLPYAIYPGPERMCFSGATIVEKDRVSALYLGISAGQMLATSSDPLLLNWSKPNGGVVRGGGGDSCVWKEGDKYYALLGSFLIQSADLMSWRDVGPFIERPAHMVPDDNACPYFWPLGDKHIFLFFSHHNGGQYYLGDYDKGRKKFVPYLHGQFNHGKVSPGGVHASTSFPDPKKPGELVSIMNINDGIPAKNWDQIMSLPQQLSLGEDKTLRIKPVDAVSCLRGTETSIGETRLPANKEVVLDDMAGRSMELELEIDPQESRWVQLDVLRSPNAAERTSITFYNFDRRISIWYETHGQLVLDTTYSSESPDAWMRPPEKALLQRRVVKGPGEGLAAGENLKLRVFIDRSVVEVFANDRLYMAARVYPTRVDSTGISLQARGRDATLKSLRAWSIKPIWPTDHAAIRE